MTSAWARAGFMSRGKPCGSAVLVWRPTRLGGKGRGRQLTSRQGCVAEPQLEALARGWCSGRAENLTCFRTSPTTAVVVTLSFSVKQGHYWGGGASCCRAPEKGLRTSKSGQSLGVTGQRRRFDPDCLPTLSCQPCGPGQVAPFLSVFVF